MSYQNISYAMSDADVNDVRNALTLVSQRMPFLVNLNTEDIRGLLKHGPGNTEFVADARFTTTNYPQIFPPTFNIVEFERDATLYANLCEFKILLESLLNKVDNTRIAVGNETMKAANQVYHYGESAKDTVPGLRPVVEKMAVRYKSQGKKKKDSDPQ
jgi:hypothetical protein